MCKSVRRRDEVLNLVSHLFGGADLVRILVHNYILRECLLLMKTQWNLAMELLKSAVYSIRPCAYDVLCMVHHHNKIPRQASADR